MKDWLKPNNWKIYWGMALQAFAVAFLTAFKMIEPTPRQQLTAGIILLIIGGIFFFRERPKRSILS